MYYLQSSIFRVQYNFFNQPTYLYGWNSSHGYGTKVGDQSFLSKLSVWYMTTLQTFLQVWSSFSEDKWQGLSPGMGGSIVK